MVPFIDPIPAAAAAAAIVVAATAAAAAGHGVLTAAATICGVPVPVRVLRVLLLWCSALYFFMGLSYVFVCIFLLTSFLA